LDIIEERIREKLTVENIADSIHFSKYHYQRMFQEIVGDSVMSYVMKRRLSLAGKELLETDASVVDVALKFGYDSHEGFTRSFKAYMGVSPADYRKYGLSAIFQENRKEEKKMMYSEITDAIIRQLNEMIVQMKTAAAYTGKFNGGNVEGAGHYTRFWKMIAEKEDAMAEELRMAMEQVTAITRRPDGISARFLLLKVIEDIVFQTNFTAFNIGLMVSRARPEHREAFRPICGKYEELAEKSREKSEKIAEFFNELTDMMFQDMRNNAKNKLKAAAEKGRTAVECLKDAGDASQGYLIVEIAALTDELSAATPEEITVSRMEDILLRLRIVSFAAETDLFRFPACKEAFEGIWAFRESVEEAVEFLKSLPGQDRTAAEEKDRNTPECIAGKRCEDLAMQGSILLFYIRGELQKLSGAHLGENQGEAFASVCNNMNAIIQLARKGERGASPEDITEMLAQVQLQLEEEAHKLGAYGGPLRFLAKEAGQMALAD